MSFQRDLEKILLGNSVPLKLRNRAVAQLTKLIEDRIIPNEKRENEPPFFMELERDGWNACIEEQRRRLR